jgi:hypothetical protein
MGSVFQQHHAVLSLLVSHARSAPAAASGAISSSTALTGAAAQLLPQPVGAQVRRIGAATGEAPPAAAGTPAAAAAAAAAAVAAVNAQQRGLGRFLDVRLLLKIGLLVMILGDTQSTSSMLALVAACGAVYAFNTGLAQLAANWVTAVCGDRLGPPRIHRGGGLPVDVLYFFGTFVASLFPPFQALAAPQPAAAVAAAFAAAAADADAAGAGADGGPGAGAAAGIAAGGEQVYAM